jgi:hypothetical protein
VQISAQGFLGVEGSFRADEGRDSIADPEITTAGLAIRRIGDIFNRRKTPRLTPKFRICYQDMQKSPPNPTVSLECPRSQPSLPSLFLILLLH